MDRPTKDVYLMALATVAAMRTTCIRRGVGCVLADRLGRVLSIGYNGVAAGLPHCNERKLGLAPYVKVGPEGMYRPPTVEWPHACKGHELPPGQDNCEAVHAEQNAILQCPDTDRIHTAYVTLSPCKACLKLLLNTGCSKIIFLEEHVDPEPRRLWEQSGRTWLQMPQQWPMVSR